MSDHKRKSIFTEVLSKTYALSRDTVPLSSYSSVFCYRVINRAPGLKLVVQTLLSSLKPIGNIVLICCTFFIIFGILGVQLFKVCLCTLCAFFKLARPCKKKPGFLLSINPCPIKYCDRWTVLWF